MYSFTYMYMHVYIYIYIHICMFLYIYMYIERATYIKLNICAEYIDICGEYMCGE